MGQYYNVVMQKFNTDEVKTYDRSADVDRETMTDDEYYSKYWCGAKLMEHSWWGNPFMNAIAKELVDNPHWLAWVGDYAEDEDMDKINAKRKHPHDLTCDDAWGKDTKMNTIHFLFKENVLDNIKYFVNLSTSEYIDLSKYKEKCDENSYGWIINPISLMTVIGNGRGGGDYHNDDSEVGAWAWDCVVLTNNLPSDCVEILPAFREDI